MTNKLTKVLLTLSVLMIFMAFGFTAFAQNYAGACYEVEDCISVLCSGGYCQSYGAPMDCEGWCHCTSGDPEKPSQGVCEGTNGN